MKQKLGAFLMASALLLGAGLTSCGETKTSTQSSEIASSIDSTKGYITVTKGSNISSYSIKVFDLVDGKPGTMTDLGEDGYVTPDSSRWIAISVTCADGYEVDKVTSNNIDATQISGFYCVNIKAAGTYKIKMTAKEKSSETVTYATVIDETTDANKANLEPVSYKMATGNHYSTILDLVDGNKVPVDSGSWLYISAAAKTGYAIDKVTVNGIECSTQFSYYVFNVSAEKATNNELKVVITTKEDSGEPTTVTYAIIGNAQIDDGVKSVTYKYCANSNFGSLTDLEDHEKLPITSGNWLCIKVECEDGYEVSSVKVNDEEATYNSGYYCKSITTAGNYSVDIDTKAKA